MTKTIRSPFDHEVGGLVEGCTILEKRVVIPPEPAEKRRGVYDYLVNVPPAPVGGRAAKAARVPVAESAGFTRATPDEMGSVIRRVGRR
jgi:hypothetical protein